MKNIYNLMRNSLKFALLVSTIFLATAMYSNSQVRITMFDPSTGSITLQNYGPATQDISSWWLCAYASAYNIIGDSTAVTLQSGSLLMAPSGQVTLFWPNHTPSGGDLSLYNTNAFTDTAAMEDFMQYGGDWGRISVANAKGIWTTGTWVNTPGPYTFIGTGTDYGALFWNNGCLGFGANVTSTNVSCSGANDGTAEAIPFGGTPPYSFLWSNGATTSMQFNLAVGVYTCTVSDISGCSTMLMATITQPLPLISTASTVANVICNGGNNGSTIAVGTGGTPPYTYNWAPSGGTTQTASNLAAGVYTCEITDINGCTTTSSTVITEPMQLITSVSTIDASCNGCSDGSATVTVTGGIPPYSYFWTPVGGINATANNLAAGTYSCIITDANGCSTIVNATINEPGVFFIQCVESTPIACVGDSGAVTAIPNGGVPPYTYSWSSGATTATANGLPPGGYTCVVTDANAATTSCFITLFPATPINAAIFTNDPTTLCYGASALLESLPNIAYTYQWKKYGNPIAGEISNTINTTGKGNYTLCVTDSNGCSAESNVIVITKIGTTPAVITSPSVVFCKGDSLKLTANSIPGSTYQWFRNGNLIPGATDSCYYTTGAGGYKVKKTDQNGCLAVSNKITVGITKPSVAITALAPHALPGPINVCVGETVVLVGSASGGAAPYTYQWFKWKKAIAGETSATYTSTVNTAQTNNRGGFRLQATDANGCTAKSRPNVQIIEVCRIGQFAKAHELELHVYPNPFSNTVSLDVVSSGDAPILIKVSDITGRVILEQKFNVADSIIPLYLQELEQGIYFIDAVQSDKKVSKKIIKAN